MDLQLQGKTVFISGATSGIGFCVAETFLKEGAKVFINGRTNDSVIKAINSLKKGFPNGAIEGVVADFSNTESVSNLMKKLPKIDILINNVGIYSAQSFFDTTDASWQEHFEVNVMSGVRLSRHLMPVMLEKNWGRILFISSECAGLVPSDLIAYSTTKTAMLSVSRGLAQLTKGTGVTVNTILPGSTMTEGVQSFLKEMAEREGKTMQQTEADFFSNTRTSSLLQRFASVQEIANTVVYFSSPLAAATNGAAIKCEGGSMGGVF